MKLTGEKKADETIRRFIQVAKELPEKIKDKIRIDTDFGIAHAIQLLRLKGHARALRKLREHPDKHIVSGIAKAHVEQTGEKS